MSACESGDTSIPQAQRPEGLEGTSASGRLNSPTRGLFIIMLGNKYTFGLS